MMSAAAGVEVSSAQGDVISASAGMEENNAAFRETVLNFVLTAFAIDDLPAQYENYVPSLKRELKRLQCALRAEDLESARTANKIEKMCAEAAFAIAGRKLSPMNPIYRSMHVAAIMLHYPAVLRGGRLFNDQMMIAEYPEMCAGLSDTDIHSLLEFRNYMAAANEIFLLKAGKNKQTFVDVVYIISEGMKKIGGDAQQLKSGGTQGYQVTSRHFIFDKESTRYHFITGC
jgi:hypothetical protein